MELHLRELLLSDGDLVSSIRVNKDQQAFSGGHAWEIFERLRNSPYREAIHPLNRCPR